MPNNYIQFSNPIPFSSSNNQINRMFPKMIKPLFSDISIVYYKKGAQSSCGVGTSRNSRMKSPRI